MFIIDLIIYNEQVPKVILKAGVLKIKKTNIVITIQTVLIINSNITKCKCILHVVKAK